MRVFLAGATGVIGRRLVPQLLAAGHHVTGMVVRHGEAFTISDHLTVWKDGKTGGKAEYRQAAFLPSLYQGVGVNYNRGASLDKVLLNLRSPFTTLDDQRCCCPGDALSVQASGATVAMVSNPIAIHHVRRESVIGVPRVKERA